MRQRGPTQLCRTTTGPSATGGSTQVIVGFAKPPLRARPRPVPVALPQQDSVQGSDPLDMRPSRAWRPERRRNGRSPHTSVSAQVGPRPGGLTPGRVRSGAGAAPARAGRRSRRGTRARGAAAPEGRPPRSSQTASAIVAPKDAVISTHVRPDRSAEARRRAEEEREEERGPGCRGSRSSARRAPGTRTRALEDALVMLDDRVRRPAPDRVRVDPRDDQRDERRPTSLLEEVEEAPRRANVAAPSFANDAGPSQPSERERRPRAPRRPRPRSTRQRHVPAAAAGARPSRTPPG